MKQIYCVTSVLMCGCAATFLAEDSWRTGVWLDVDGDEGVKGVG